MTEKEKMLQGLLYDANYDSELINQRHRCKDLCFEFNHLKPSDTENQLSVLSKILGKAEKDVQITAPFYCDYGYNIEIGKSFYANHNLVILDCAKVMFGDFVFIGPNCCFATAGHPLDAAQRNKGLEFAHPIRVGNNVWIGANVVVLSGVSIGDNTVIGAGSIVTKNIPANVVAVGTPCRILRSITE